MANRAIFDLADRIAAVAPASDARHFWQDCQPALPIPVPAIPGEADHAEVVLSAIDHHGHSKRGSDRLPAT
jgi:hypothetical protein